MLASLRTADPQLHAAEPPSHLAAARWRGSALCQPLAETNCRRGELHLVAGSLEKERWLCAGAVPYFGVVLLPRSGPCVLKGCRCRCLVRGCCWHHAVAVAVVMFAGYLEKLSGHAKNSSWKLQEFKSRSRRPGSYFSCSFLGSPVGRGTEVPGAAALCCLADSDHCSGSA